MVDIVGTDDDDDDGNDLFLLEYYVHWSHCDREMIRHLYCYCSRNDGGVMVLNCCDWWNYYHHHPPPPPHIDAAMIPSWIESHNQDLHIGYVYSERTRLNWQK